MKGNWSPIAFWAWLHIKIKPRGSWPTVNFPPNLVIPFESKQNLAVRFLVTLWDTTSPSWHILHTNLHSPLPLSLSWFILPFFIFPLFILHSHVVRYFFHFHSQNALFIFLLLNSIMILLSNNCLLHKRIKILFVLVQCIL